MTLDEEEDKAAMQRRAREEVAFSMEEEWIGMEEDGCSAMREDNRGGRMLGEKRRPSRRTAIGHELRKGHKGARRTNRIFSCEDRKVQVQRGLVPISVDAAVDVESLPTLDVAEKIASREAPLRSGRYVRQSLFGGEKGHVPTKGPEVL